MLVRKYPSYTWNGERWLQSLVLGCFGSAVRFDLDLVTGTRSGIQHTITITITNDPELRYLRLHVPTHEGRPATMHTISREKREMDGLSGRKVEGLRTIALFGRNSSG